MFKPTARTLIALLLLGFLLGGCAGRQHVVRAPRVSFADYVPLEQFCSEHKLQCTFDTIDDTVKVYSSDIDARILLNTPLAIVQGAPVMLEHAVVQHKGTILVPQELSKFLTRKKTITFRPIFQIKTIVLDPGHGGKDPGAISPRGLQEKTLNLLVAKTLQDRLRRQGYNVILTREGDIYLTLSQRVEFARKHNADLFISIHANANRSRMVSGVEVYYLNPERLNSAQRAYKLSKAGRFQNAVLSADVAAILWDLVFTKNHSFSMEFAHVLYYNFKKLGFSIKPPKTAGFHVLRYAYVPSVLLEIGYLSNVNEEKALRSTHYQKQIAEAVILSINALQDRYGVSGAERFVLSP